MTLHIPPSSVVEARLREYAAAAGRDVSSLVAEAIDDKLSALDEEASERTRRPRTAAQWIAELRAWAASHPHLEYVADDSREGIYADHVDRLA